VFRIQVVSNNDVRSPIVTLGSTSFFHVRVNNVYVLAVTKYVRGLVASSHPANIVDLIRSNANAALVFEFCYRFTSIAKSYFGKLDEEAVKNNFVLIYELIDGASIHPMSGLITFLIRLHFLQKFWILDTPRIAK
jgi:AP-2 complex subunit mu-1